MGLAALWQAWTRLSGGTPGVLQPAGPLPPITFPTTPLTVKVEVALGADLTADPATWGWADATGYIYTRDAITIVRGRADQASTADTSTCDLTANNRDGRWSTRNPNGAWYGLLRKGTPIRVSAEGYPRFSGFLSALPPRWDISGEDRYAPLSAKGLFYRLTQGASPQRSALRRTILGAGPVAYWALEDDATATELGPGVGGGTSMTIIGAPALGDVGPVGSTGAVDFSAGGSLSAPLSGVSSTSWCVMCVVNATAGASIETIFRLRMSPGSAWDYIAFGDQIGASGYAITGHQPSDTTNGANTSAVAVDDWHLVALVGRNGVNGATIDAYVDGVFGATVFTAGTIGSPVGIVLNQYLPGVVSPAPANLPGSVCHVAVFSNITIPPDISDAVNGYPGEAAHTRFLRLCAEENIPASAIVAENRSVLMGPQPVDAILPLLRECEAADQAFLYEGVNFDLVFQGHTGRENLVAALALDYDNSAHGIVPPLEPTDDDQDARNDVEVKRDGGSSYRLTEEDPLVELSIPNIGRRDESVTYKISNDEQTRDLAGWRLHLGTYPGYRFPALTLNLAAAPGLIPEFAAAGLGFLTTIDNPPDDIGPDQIALIVEGYTETLGAYDWDVAANCSLNGPWHVFTTAEDSGDIGDFLGYLIPDSCVTCEALDTTETEILFFSEPRFSTDSDDWTPPAALRIGGEEIALSAVASAASDAFGRTETDTWGVATTGQTWITNQSAADWDVTTTPFGHGTVSITTLAGDYLAIFDVAHPDVDLVATFRLDTLPASGEYRFGLSGRSTLATTGADASFYHGEAQINSAGQITLRLRKRVQGTQSNLASRVVGTLTAGSAYRLRFAVVGTTLTVKLWAGDVSADGDEPRWWLLSVTDESLDGVTLGGTYAGVFARNDTAATTHVLSVDDYAVLRPQLATVARSQNTISKSHPTATPFEFANPGVLGL